MALRHQWTDLWPLVSQQIFKAIFKIISHVCDVFLEHFIVIIMHLSRSKRSTILSLSRIHQSLVLYKKVLTLWMS